MKTDFDHLPDTQRTELERVQKILQTEFADAWHAAGLAAGGTTCEDILGARCREMEANCTLLIFETPRVISSAPYIRWHLSRIDAPVRFSSAPEKIRFDLGVNTANPQSALAEISRAIERG